MKWFKHTNNYVNIKIRLKKKKKLNQVHIKKIITYIYSIFYILI